MRAQVIAATELRPLRLTFAQFCIWCGVQWCGSAECVRRHEATPWVVCDECDGTLGTPEGRPCTCLYGLVEGGTVEAPDTAMWMRLESLAAIASEDAARRAAQPRAPIAPCLPGAPGSLAYDPEHAEYVAYKAGRRS